MALIMRILCRDIDFGQNFQFQLSLPTYIDAYWKITIRLIYKQSNNNFQVSFFQKFPTIMDVYGWQYEKKITILNIAKIQFLVFPWNLDFLGMKFCNGRW